MPMNKQKQIIVTGATGFIGSNLLYALESEGYTNIVGIDDFGNGEKWKNVAKRSCVFFILPDQMKDYLDIHSQDISAIIHLGGISTTTETNVDEIVRTNIQLSIYLYEYCKKNDIQFIYASSAATYGYGVNDWDSFEDNQDIDSLRKLKPLNAYGWSKNCIDKYIVLDREGKGNKNQVVGLKFFNVYGPNEYHKREQMSVVAKFYKQYQKYGKAKLFKFETYTRMVMQDKRSPRRDFVYVDDCIDVMIWFLEHKEINGIYNVGTGVARTFQDVAYNVAKELGKEPEIEYIEMPESLVSQYQDYTCANIDKLRNVGYLKDMTSLEDGICDYINKYLNSTDKFK